MVKFDEIIGASIEWTTTVLFRPFQAKKWLILTFIALLAGALAGNSFNYSSHSNYKEKKAHARQLQEGSNLQVAKINPPKAKSLSKQELKNFLRENFFKRNPFLIIPIIIIGLIILIILSWLCARFYFIFLEDVTKNDASIVKLFKSNKTIGNSFFKFNLATLGIFVLLILLTALGGFFSLNKMGVFDKNISVDPWRIFVNLFPEILAVIAIILMMILIYLIINDFVLVVMLRDKIKIIPAIKKTLSILLANKANLIVYILIKFALSIVSSIIYSIIYFISIIGLIFPAAIIASILYFIFMNLPHNIQSPFLAVTVVIAFPFILFIAYCFMCLNLPFAVFFRTFSVKFFGRLDGRYNLFMHTYDQGRGL